MQTSPRPRHIRDIAHLYLSRRKKGARAPCTDILVTSSGRGCFSGLHVACLAAGFSRRDVAVDIYELSGLLPNASFYLGHPPSVYLSRGSGRRRFQAALGGISIAFDPSLPGMVGGDNRRVRLFHLPPVRPAETLQAALAPLLNDDGPSSLWMLVLYDGASPPVSEVPDVGGAGRFALALRGPSRHGGTAGHLGTVDGWTCRVNDRLPFVVRDPRWALSRDYQTICDSMLNQIDRAARRKDGEHLANASPGHRSGR